jgi:hypothetical protein
MEKIYIEGSQDTPSIILNKEENKFEITGKSFPADVSAFYKPVIQWLDKYSSEPNTETVFILKMDYFNTASSKVILDILYKLEDLSNDGNVVKIKWYYPDDDEDMKETGEEYDEIVDIPFELIEYTVEFDD